MSMQDDHRELAADYVMGLLDPAEEAKAERLMSTDESFARAVSAWRERLADFDATAEPVAPSPALWNRITETIKVAPTPDSSVANRVTLWDNIRFWRTAAISGALAASLLMVLAIGALVTSRQLQTDLAELSRRKPVYVAVLVSDATREAGAIVNAFADGRVELVPLRPIDVPPGKALQVWTLWDRAVGPKSVGLTGQSRTLQLDLKSLPATVQDQLFEITLEPEGGSPIGRPTGPILFKGNTARAL
jgi:anti-sigma-K factor RskA